MVALFLTHTLKYQTFFQRLLQCLNKYFQFLHEQLNYLLNHTKIHTLQVCVFVILINLNEHEYLHFFISIALKAFEKRLCCMIIRLGYQTVSIFFCCYKFLTLCMVFLKAELFISLKKSLSKSFLLFFLNQYWYQCIILTLFLIKFSDFIMFF